MYHRWVAVVARITGSRSLAAEGSGRCYDSRRCFQGAYYERWMTVPESFFRAAERTFRVALVIDQRFA